MALFVAINAKYVHTSLSVRSLQKAAGDAARILECTINDSVQSVAEEIFMTGEKHILFSSYLWNIEMVLKLCEMLKKADDSFLLSLGGPEVSYRADEILAISSFVDHVLCGEGERGIRAFIENPPKRGVYHFESVEDMDALPFPYTRAELSTLRDRLVYYETSRGCPYHCAFCLSSAEKGVRFRSVERVEEELLCFIESGVGLVKLVDRTFNADNERAVRLVEFIKTHAKKTSFHFEVKAESMSDELIQSLAESPKGLFQLEIGVQSTDAETLRRIGRHANLEKLKEVITRLAAGGNIPLHLDLIAGLPGESLETFIRSFNEVFALRPTVLQLGFLKRLFGAGITEKDGVFAAFPPYEVIRTEAMHYADIILLKSVSACLERLYNSGAFPTTLSALLKEYDSPFSMFCTLGEAIDFKTPIARKALYEKLYVFSRRTFGDTRLKDYLIYDFCLRNSEELSFMERDAEIKPQAFAFLKDDAKVQTYFPQYAALKPTERYKKLRFVRLFGKVYGFDRAGGIAREVSSDFPPDRRLSAPGEGVERLRKRNA